LFYLFLKLFLATMDIFDTLKLLLLLSQFISQFSSSQH